MKNATAYYSSGALQCFIKLAPEFILQETTLNTVDKQSCHQGSLTEWEGSVPLTSMYQLLNISSFFEKILFTIFYISSYLNEEVNCTSPSVSIPCCHHHSFSLSLSRSNFKRTFLVLECLLP
jgi:hypothetical protein